MQHILRRGEFLGGVGGGFKYFRELREGAQKVWRFKGKGRIIKTFWVILPQIFNNITARLRNWGRPQKFVRTFEDGQRKVSVRSRGGGYGNFYHCGIFQPTPCNCWQLQEAWQIDMCLFSDNLDRSVWISGVWTALLWKSWDIWGFRLWLSGSCAYSLWKLCVYRHLTRKHLNPRCRP